MKLSEIKGISELTMLSGVFLLGYEETEYRARGRVTLHVYSNGTCRIMVGTGTNNIHVLSHEVADMHKTKFEAPYFCYKYGTTFKDVRTASYYYNKWKEKRLAQSK